MNQVEYNIRYAKYNAEQKAIARKYRAIKAGMEPGSDEEEALGEEEEAELDEARKFFQADTVNFKG